jgi:hypothetical protein
MLSTDEGSLSEQSSLPSQIYINQPVAAPSFGYSLITQFPKQLLIFKTSRYLISFITRMNLLEDQEKATQADRDDSQSTPPEPSPNSPAHDISPDSPLNAESQHPKAPTRKVTGFRVRALPFLLSPIAPSLK